MTRKSHELSAAEDVARKAGFDLPIAWGLGFIADGHMVLIVALEDAGYSFMAEEVRAIADWVANGDPNV